MKKIGAFVLALGLAAFGYAEEKKFFEPSQADYDCCSVKIMEQQDAYKKAKAAGEFENALKNSLFYHVSAWLQFNKAMGMITNKEGWNSIETLNNAVSLMNEAEANAKASKHEDAKEILKLVKRNRKMINDQIKALSK